MTKEQAQFLLSALQKIAGRMKELEAIGVDKNNTGQYEVALTIHEVSVLAQLANIGYETVTEVSPMLQAAEFAKEHFGIDLGK